MSDAWPQVWNEVFVALGHDITAPDALERLARIKKVELSGKLKKKVSAAALTKRIDTLAPLASCPMLKSLDITAAPFADLSPLAGLSALESIVIWKTRVADLSPLAGKKKLTDLYVWCTEVASLEPLREVPNLTRLNVEYTQVTDLAPLAGMTKLTELSLAGCAVHDLRPLRDVPLVDLILHRTPVAAAEIEAFQAAHPGCRVQTGDVYPVRGVRCC